EAYDVAIIGGGLAGLSSSIELAELGHSVILFEKEQYPFHRVCGEYISMESWDYLKRLGIDLPELHVPIITTLRLSNVRGRTLTQPLPLGGFTISRYILDAALANCAKAAGVTICQATRVDDVQYSGDGFSIV